MIVGILWLCMATSEAATMPVRADMLNGWLKQFRFDAAYESASRSDHSLGYEYEDPREAGVFFSYSVQSFKGSGDAKDYFETLESTVRETFAKEEGQVVLVVQPAPDYGDRVLVFHVENQGETVGMVNLICDGNHIYGCTLMGAFLDAQDVVAFMKPILKLTLPKP